jgi:hypothetical protein
LLVSSQSLKSPAKGGGILVRGQAVAPLSAVGIESA